MVINPSIINAVEKLGHRVTSGDVATQAGIDINIAQRELLVLASEAGGHLQVAESGEIAFAFPGNFRAILRNKYWQLKLKDGWNKIWKVLFYLIRISFGIILIASILMIVAAIITILVVINTSQNNNNSGGNRSGSWFWIGWLMPDFRWFYPDNHNNYQQQKAKSSKKKQMNFLESVFSFIFGDGNPNYNLEERRWQTIGKLIQNQKGAIIAEQITPYLDEIGSSVAQEYEDYMLPILTRFDGRPEVSPEGQLIYHFPELQTTATSSPSQSVPTYLKEKNWRFSLASSGQIMGAIGLGGANLIGALMLGSLLKTPEIAGYLTGFLGFMNVIYPLLLIYGVGFLTIPLIRYYWIQWKNKNINGRNAIRKERTHILAEGDSSLNKKLDYARQFAKKIVINSDDLAYTTETDLLEQEINNSDKTDMEWQKRLEENNPDN